MTRFLDGPAVGQTLMLKRSPIFLRVTVGNSGKVFDALDQLSDTPMPSELLFCYQLSEFRGSAFIDGPKCRGCFPMADYALCKAPPADEVMRDNQKWANWTETFGRELADKNLTL